jgi:hypothetical protein
MSEQSDYDKAMGAFDCGLGAAARGKTLADNPYEAGWLKQFWICGFTAFRGYKVG